MNSPQSNKLLIVSVVILSGLLASTKAYSADGASEPPKTSEKPQAKPEDSADAKAVLSTLEAAEAAAQAAYKRAVIAAKRKALEDLEKVRAKATKADKLDLAVAIKARMDQIKAEVEELTSKDKAGTKIDESKVSEADRIKQAIVGTWTLQYEGRSHTERWILNADGTIGVTNHIGENFSGTWKNNGLKIQLTVNGVGGECVLSQAGDAMTGVYNSTKFKMTH